MAVVNEDANEKLIKQLRAEMQSLRRQLEGKDAKLDLEAEREKIKRELEEKFQRELQEKQALWEKEMNGVDGGVEEEGLEEEVGGMYLVNLNEDAALSGVLKYKLKAGENWVGSGGGGLEIVIGGMGVVGKHGCLCRKEGGVEGEGVAARRGGRS